MRTPVVNAKSTFLQLHIWQANVQDFGEKKLERLFIPLLSILLNFFWAAVALPVCTENKAIGVRGNDTSTSRRTRKDSQLSTTQTNPGCAKQETVLPEQSKPITPPKRKTVQVWYILSCTCDIFISNGGIGMLGSVKSWRSGSRIIGIIARLINIIIKWHTFEFCFFKSFPWDE